MITLTLMALGAWEWCIWAAVLWLDHLHATVEMALARDYSTCMWSIAGMHDTQGQACTASVHCNYGIYHVGKF